MFTKTINGLFRVGLPQVGKILHRGWMRCRLVQLHEAPNRVSAQKKALGPSYRAHSIPPAQSPGYILSHPSYTSSVRLSVRGDLYGDVTVSIRGALSMEEEIIKTQNILQPLVDRPQLKAKVCIGNW